VATATTQSDKDLIPPSAPTGLTAAGAKKKIDLTWSASTDTGGSGLAGYTVWRGTGGASGSFTAIATSQSSSYSDTTVANKVTYWYRVTALDGGVTRVSHRTSSRPSRSEAVEVLSAGHRTPLPAGRKSR
jgi:hypothetical protein